MVYKFDTFKKEHLRCAWLSGNYTDKELIKKYGDAYELFCFNHGYEMEELPEFEVVCVAAIRAGRIVTSTSCYRKDAHKYAKYYSSIGYHVKTMTYDELEKFNQQIETENREMLMQMV